MHKFKFKTWGGGHVVVENITHITFEPEHVAFWQHGFLVLAEKNTNVVSLEEVKD